MRGEFLLLLLRSFGTCIVRRSSKMEGIGLNIAITCACMVITFEDGTLS